MKKELKIGIFIVTVVVASFFVLNYLRGKDVFDREYELSAKYDNLQGLVASAPVYIQGYKVGKVNEVAYDAQTSSFKVTCSVANEFKVPSDSKMTIYSVDIMGGKGVKIDLGTSESLASDGDTLAARFEAGLMDGLSEGVGPLIQKVNSTLDSLETTVSSVNSVLADANRQSIERTLKHLETLMGELSALSADVNDKSSEITGLVDNLTAFSAELGGIAEKVDTALTGVNAVVGALDGSDIEGVVSSLQSLLDNVNDPDGTIGKLLTDGSVYDSVDSLLNDINVLIDKIQENPKKYLKISVF